MTTQKILGVLLAGALLSLGGSAQAGRGASYGGLKSVIASNSPDAIVSEIERAEKLVCLACIDVVMPLVDHDSQRVRDAAAWWLGKRGVRDEVIDTMIARLAVGQDPIQARNAADVLAGMRDMKGLQPLMAYVQKPLDEASGQAAARALGELGHPQAMTALRAAFGSPLVGVRVAALQASRNLRAPTGAKAALTVDAVVPLLADADAGVRREAAYSAGWLKDRGAVQGLIAMLGDSSAVVRKAAAWALGEIGDASAATALQALRNDADATVRSVATGALGRLGR